MTSSLVLASASQARAAMLSAAGLEISVSPARLDEVALRTSMCAEGLRPRDIAGTLAEHKARKVSTKLPGALILGADQILVHDGEILGKPDSLSQVRAQLQRLRGTTHELLAAAVLVRDGLVLWRHVDVARLTLRQFSDSYLTCYLERNWPGLGDTVGGYKLEEEGVRLFSRIDGSNFTVLGLPLLPLLNHLSRSGEIPA
jgi:septum formation protein